MVLPSSLVPLMAQFIYGMLLPDTSCSSGITPPNFMPGPALYPGLLTAHASLLRAKIRPYRCGMPLLGTFFSPITATLVGCTPWPGRQTEHELHQQVMTRQCRSGRQSKGCQACDDSTREQ